MEDCYAALAMTTKKPCHCEERSDEAIPHERLENWSHSSGSPLAWPLCRPPGRPRRPALPRGWSRYSRPDRGDGPECEAYGRPAPARHILSLIRLEVGLLRHRASFVLMPTITDCDMDRPFIWPPYRAACRGCDRSTAGISRKRLRRRGSLHKDRLCGSMHSRHILPTNNYFGRADTGVTSIVLM